MRLQSEDVDGATSELRELKARVVELERQLDQARATACHHATESAVLRGDVDSLSV